MATVTKGNSKKESDWVGFEVKDASGKHVCYVNVLKTAMTDPSDGSKIEEFINNSNDLKLTLQEKKEPEVARF